MIKGNIKRVFSTILCIGLIFNTTSTASASEINYKNDINMMHSTVISINEDGLFSEVSFDGYNTSKKVNSKDEYIEIEEMGGNVYRACETDRYFSRLPIGRYMEVGKVTIDLTNEDSIYNAVNINNLSTETRDRLLELSQDDKSGKINLKMVHVYSANALNEEISLRNTTTTRTYVGYRDRTYYEELIHYWYVSPTVDLYTNSRDAFNAYLSKSFEEVVNFSIGLALDAVLKGSFSLLSLGHSLLPTSVVATTTGKHTAYLSHDQYEKLTFIYEGTNLFMGSRVTTGSYYFVTTVQDSHWNTPVNKTTTTKFYRTPNYDFPDIKAHQNYLNMPWNEYAQSVTHGYVTFSLN